ncbi:MAG: hypothetical protein E7598_00880 [Ruminococcaceae bacterium]|nr:hypothetical protein [Oscillospiraceae bacterium]
MSNIYLKKEKYLIPLLLLWIDISGVTGEKGALNDYGCLHFDTPILLGISEPAYSEAELAHFKEEDSKQYTIDKKTKTGYGWTQVIRHLETALREQKRIMVAAQASGDNYANISFSKKCYFLLIRFFFISVIKLPIMFDSNFILRKINIYSFTKIYVPALSMCHFFTIE